MAITKLDSPALMADQVFEALRDEIMSGSLPPGYRLRVRDVAAQVGTSVMPVREAIQRLEDAGLAERSPRRGAVVKALTLQELRHVYGVRALLEVEATRLGSARVTPEGLDAMLSACDGIVRAVGEGDALGAIDGDEALLRTLYGFADNPVLLDLIEDLWRRCRLYKLVGARRAIENDDNSLWSFQSRLVEAARAGDVDAAVSVAAASLASAVGRIEHELGR